MILFDTIKIKYIQTGYLPDWPYHLISDSEMLDAFINNESNFFEDNYKLDSDDESLMKLYQALKDDILFFVNEAKRLNTLSILPEWVVSYMLGAVVSETSNLKEIDDLIALSNLVDDVPAGQFNDILYRSNAKISREWIAKLPSSKKEHRPVSVFGEPHVIKSLRLAKVDVLN